MPSIKALLIHSKYIKWLEIEENGGLFKSTGQHSWTILTKGPKGGIQWVLLILPGDRRLKAREQLEELFSPPASYLAFSIKLRSLYLCEIKNKTKKNPHKHKTQQKKPYYFHQRFSPWMLHFINQNWPYLPRLFLFLSLEIILHLNKKKKKGHFLSARN